MARGFETWLAAVTLATVLWGCSHPSGTTYVPSETGTLMRVEQVELVSSREVLISGLDYGEAAGWGTAVGATVAGAAAYDITGTDGPGGVAITVASGIAGGPAGRTIEERRETLRGAEYVLQSPEGATFAIVQSLAAGEPIYQPGAAVAFIYGARGYVRVVPDQG